MWEECFETAGCEHGPGPGASDHIFRRMRLCTQSMFWAEAGEAHAALEPAAARPPVEPAAAGQPVPTEPAAAPAAAGQPVPIAPRQPEG